MNKRFVTISQEDEMVYLVEYSEYHLEVIKKTPLMWSENDSGNLSQNTLAALYSADNRITTKSKFYYGTPITALQAIGVDEMYSGLLEATLEPIEESPQNMTSITVNGIEYTIDLDGVLDLSRLGLETLPDSIGELKGLKRLYLHGNKLTTLPTPISKLNELEWLNLRGNNLTTLPESIGELKELKCLNLIGNKLTTLPNSICGLKGLEVLDLSGNKLTTLPESIGELKGLEVLDLSGNKLTTLPESIGELKGLKYLYLRGNNLTASEVHGFRIKGLLPNTEIVV